MKRRRKAAKAKVSTDEEAADTFDDNVAWHIAAHQLTGDPTELSKLQQASGLRLETGLASTYRVGDRVYPTNPVDHTLRGMQGTVRAVIDGQEDVLYYVCFHDGRSAMIPACEVSKKFVHFLSPHTHRDPICLDEKVQYMGPLFSVTTTEKNTEVMAPFPENFWEKDMDADQMAMKSNATWRLMSPRARQVGRSQDKQADDGSENDEDSGDHPIIPAECHGGAKSNTRWAPVTSLAKHNPNPSTVVQVEIEPHEMGTVNGFVLREPDGQDYLVSVKFEHKGLHNISLEHIKKVDGRQSKLKASVLGEVEVEEESDEEEHLPPIQRISSVISSVSVFSDGPVMGRTASTLSSPSNIMEVSAQQVPSIDLDTIEMRMENDQDTSRRMLPKELQTIAEPSSRSHHQDDADKIQTLGAECVGMDAEVFAMLYQKNTMSQWWA